jgi:hypothetical protein
MGTTSDDIKLKTFDMFKGKEVVVTEKMDGENTTMYRDHIHARSLDSAYHPSRTWVNNLWGKINYLIPEEVRLCGENMFWVHSIVYTELPSYFLLFSVWSGDTCLSWDETCSMATELGLDTVPVLYRGGWDEKLVKSLYGPEKSNTSEGYVVRVASSFKYQDFSTNVAKFVREKHVQTDQHWLRSGGELNMLKIKK